MKLTKEQKQELALGLELWGKLCDIADKEMNNPITKQTQVIIDDLKTTKEYLESTFGCWVYHPLMDFDVNKR